MLNAINFAEITAELKPLLPRILSDMFPAGKKRGNEFLIGDVNGGKGSSTSVNLTTGLWGDFAAGDAGKDIISLYAAHKSLNNGQSAVALARQYLGRELYPKDNPQDWKQVRRRGLVPPSQVFHPKFGEPVRTWWYPDHGMACRFESLDIHGEIKKDVLPYSWCRNRMTGEENWRWKAFSEPRPLYYIPAMLEDANTPVLIVEGEKAADAAAEVLGTHAVCTWPGGGNAVKKADFKPLEGRQVTIWPDNDEPGQKVVRHLLHILDGAAVVQIPSGKKKGWDAADASPQEIVDLVAAAVLCEAPPADPDDEEDDKKPAWVKPYVYVAATDRIHCKETLSGMSPTAFNLKFSKEVPWRDGTRPTAFRWIMEHGWMQVVDTVAYVPGEGRLCRDPLTGHSVLNGYEASGIPKAPEELSNEEEDLVTLLTRHVEWLCSGDGRVALHLLNFMRHNVQHPGRKIRWLPLICSRPGAGKSVLEHAMRAAMGPKNIKTVHARVVMSDFNAWASGAAVCFLEELKITGHSRHDASNALKQAITDDTVSINQKRKDHYEVANRQNYVAFSNFMDAVPLEEGDRRWMVIRLAEDDIPGGIHRTFNMEPGEYFSKLFEGIAKYPGAVRSWLEEPIDYSMVPGIAPDTEAKTHMILDERGLTPGLDHAEAAIEEGTAPYVRQNWFSQPDLFIEIEKRRGLERRKVMETSGAEFQPLRELTAVERHRICTRLGFVRHSKRKVDGTERMIWVRHKNFKGEKGRELLDRELRKCRSESDLENI